MNLSISLLLLLAVAPPRLLAALRGAVANGSALGAVRRMHAYAVQIENEIAAAPPGPDAEEGVWETYQDIERGAFPYNARVQTWREAGRSTCTGTLISKDRVLTAGHCCYPTTPISKIDVGLATVTLNGHNIRIDYVDAAMPPLYTSNRAASRAVWDWDLCVVRLDKEEVPDTIKPAPIVVQEPDQPISISISKGYTYGWGRQDEGDSPQPVRQLRGMRIKASTAACHGYNLGTRQHFIHAGNMWEESNAPKYICSYPREDVGLCDGDSGAPLLVDGVVVGVYVARRIEEYTIADKDSTVTIHGRAGRSCLGPHSILNVFVNLAAPEVNRWLAGAAPDAARAACPTCF